MAKGFSRSRAAVLAKVFADEVIPVHMLTRVGVNVKIGGKTVSVSAKDVQSSLKELLKAGLLEQFSEKELGDCARWNSKMKNTLSELLPRPD